MKGAIVKEQIQWILLYVQGGSADVWKEILLEDLETKEVKFRLAGEFLLELRKEFEGGDKKSVKVAELRKIKQEGKTMEEFVQEFKRATRRSEYQGRALVKEFKRGMNGEIKRKLIEVERPPFSIKQWYNYTINLD